MKLRTELVVKWSYRGITKCSSNWKFKMVLQFISGEIVSLITGFQLFISKSTVGNSTSNESSQKLKTHNLLLLKGTIIFRITAKEVVRNV